MKNNSATSVLPCALLLSVLSVRIFMACAEHLPAGGDPPEAISGNPVADEMVVYEVGSMPVIILVPHDGTAKPDGMPLRKKSTRDVNTAKLARELCTKLSYTDSKGMQRRPHLVINLASRAVVDPNLSWEKNIQAGWFHQDGKPAAPPARAGRIHRAFHSSAAHAVRMVKKEFGTGILLDLHGLSSTRKTDMYGYLISSREFIGDTAASLSSDQTLAHSVRTASSMQHAASLKQTDREIADMIRGSQSLATLVDKAYRESYPAQAGNDGQADGRPATPSAQFPNPKKTNTPDQNTVYFNGAYDIFAHSSRQQGIRVDAVQIETTADARNTKEQRERFARCMATALRQFLNIHYNLNITPTAATQRERSL